MSDKNQTVLPASEVRTTLTRSEQRKKNRQENRGQKKTETAEGPVAEGRLTRIYNFFVEAQQELKRVVWPTRKETIDSTWRLLILVILAGLYLGLVDSLLTRLLGLILS